MTIDVGELTCSTYATWPEEYQAMLPTAGVAFTAIPSLRPASSALVVWENSWAARFASAVRGSHGEVAAFEWIPYETGWRALTALEE
jgi:hypothetical protein